MSDRDIEPFRTIPHADFMKAMELLGLEGGNLFNLSLGPWNGHDLEMFPLADLMQQDAGAWWRIRAVVGLAQPGMSDMNVRYIGIGKPTHLKEEQ